MNKSQISSRFVCKKLPLESSIVYVCSGLSHVIIFIHQLDNVAAA